MKVFLFTARYRERLRAWLESGVEDDGTRMLFVGDEKKPEQDRCGLGASGEGGPEAVGSG